MFTLNRKPNRFHRQCYLYALVGFAVIGIGYVLRGQLSQTSMLVMLLLGIFPNLIGSFATPFYLAYFLGQRYPNLNALDRPLIFGLINLFTFAVSVVIEYLHVLFQAGAWDPNDIAASAAGGLAAMAVYSLTQRVIKTAGSAA